MTKFFIMGVSILILAYFCGLHSGRAKCTADFILEQNLSDKQTQQQFIQKTEVINAEVFHTGVADIRQRLREQYTIAE